jgi:hypothetical protein
MLITVSRAAGVGVRRNGSWSAGLAMGVRAPSVNPKVREVAFPSTQSRRGTYNGFQ